MNDRYCKQCGERFTPNRRDQYFHAPKCVAAYYRDNPNPDFIHAANDGEHWYTCEHCGVDFYVNDYANRGGKRRPKYHSRACKQAAYRARNQDTQQQAKRRSEGAQGTKKQQAPPPQGKQAPPNSAPPPQGKQAPPPPQGKQAPPKWDYVGTKDRSSSARREAHSILGLEWGKPHNPAQIKKAYIEKINFWHPDRNTSGNATAYAQAINWAYEVLGK